MENNYADEIIENKNQNAELKKEEMKEEMFSSLANNKNIFEEIDPEKKDKKKSIKFIGWLPDILDWIKRIELAQSSLNTSLYIFHQHCYRKLHGRLVKPRIVRRLKFSYDCDDAGNEWSILHKVDRNLIPIADINPPEYIIGFEEIEFDFIDDRALQFVEKILPLFKDGIEIFGKFYWTNRKISSIRNLMSLLASKRKRLEIKFHINLSDNFTNFNQHFPSIIFGIQSIFIMNTLWENMDLLMKWLNVPLQGGRPKMLGICLGFTAQGMALIDRIKEEFSNSSVQQANFIILINIRNFSFDDIEEIENFKIENQKTEEILELYNSRNVEYFLIRHKKDGKRTTKEDWLKQMKKKLKTTISIQ